MKINLMHLGLAIDSPLVNEQTSDNFRPHTWPPSDDFPVLIDAEGCIVSRYGDDRWNLSAWDQCSRIVNFGDGPQRKDHPSISTPNADLYRQVMAWLLWGPGAARNARTFVSYASSIRPLFIHCSKERVTASDLARFPAVVDKLIEKVAGPSGFAMFLLLHRLFEARDQLGFTLFDRNGLRRFEAALPDPKSRQTPYIPPRIWVYQLNRLRLFLDDFLEHSDSIKACFRFCVKAYEQRAESLGESPSRRALRDGPFNLKGADTFAQTAARFGLETLLQRWCLPPGASPDGLSVSTFASYFTMAQQVAVAYVLNFSMMRIGEAWSLRCDCLQIEHDPTFGPFYVVRGETTKTVEDSDARWITSPSVKVAIDVATLISKLRSACASNFTTTTTSFGSEANPFLAVRSYEPWGNDMSRDSAARPAPPSYLSLMTEHPNLFDREELRITRADLQFARMVTPSLDAQTFKVGKVWPLAWHQLRRTGAVNMQASGVPATAVQYQLKHATVSMSLYYGQGYSRVKFNASASAEYVRTIYEVLGREIAQLLADRFVSPFGERRKSQILSGVSAKNRIANASIVRAGDVSWRETLLGGCTSGKPCKFGGVDNLVRCGGADGRPPCPDALYDKERESDLRQLERDLIRQRTDSPKRTPLNDSLAAQLRAVRNVLHAIKS